MGCKFIFLSFGIGFAIAGSAFSGGGHLRAQSLERNLEQEVLGEASSQAHPLLKSWEGGVRPMAPQKYDGYNGQPQMPFVSRERLDKGSPFF